MNTLNFCIRRNLLLAFSTAALLLPLMLKADASSELFSAGATRFDVPAKADSAVQLPSLVSGQNGQAMSTASSSSTQSITSDFNGTKLVVGNTIWLSSVVKVSAVRNSVVNLNMFNSTLSFSGPGGQFTVSVPAGSLRLLSGTSSASTSFDGASWNTSAPSALNGNAFIAGVAIPITPQMAAGIKSVTWSASFTADQSGLNVNWQWAAAVYKQFGQLGSLGVKPVDNNQISAFKNSDHAGTPEYFKTYVTGGARGGGGSNYTGSYSGTASFQPPGDSMPPS